MNVNTYLNCLSYYGIHTGVTGAVLGVYDTASGSGNAVFYNQIYPSGYHFSGNNFYGPAIPLISVGRGNAAGQQFSGVNCYRFGFTQSGDFGVLLDIEYSGCSRTGTGVAYTLFSTADNPTGSTGTFFIGVDEANRLFFQSSGYSKTLNYELKPKNLVYVGLGGQQYVNFGVWDVLRQDFNFQEITLPRSHDLINKLYIGGFLNNTDRNYTGYFGRILNAVLLDKPLEASGVRSLGNCIFSTGSATGALTTGLIYLSVVTGYLLSGIVESVVTGYVPYSGVVTKADNTTVNVVFPSGVTGSQTIQQVATALTGYTTIPFTGQPTVTFLKDTSKLNGFIMYDLEFDLPLTSGDTLEIYTFPDYNSKVNLFINGIDYPVSTEPIQLIGNGLVETLGTDYFVVRDQISGFFEDDILMYDLLTGLPLVSSYSGYWARDKVQMSGGAFFPSAPQFIEASGKIYVTGVTGNALVHGSDVFINGQKIISGYNYSMFKSGTLVILELNPTGLPALYADMIYPSTGGLPTGVGDVQDAELSIIPNYGQFTRYYYDVATTQSYVSGITGYTEEVWVNGVRQREFADYVKVFQCTQNSGYSDPPNVPLNFYNNETSYFNIT
jgi:hypothetical protein